MAIKTRWWALQDNGDPAPYAVAAVAADGLARRYVPGEGLVDWPSLTSITRGEFGSHPITEAEAQALIKRGVGKIDSGIVARARGTAPTIPV